MPTGRGRALLLAGITAVVAQAIAASAVAQDPAGKDLEDALRAIREKHGVPALAGAIVAADGITRVAAVGERQAGSGNAVTTQDLWHVGSCTKSMTATLIGIHAETGKLPFETTLAKAFPRRAKKMDPAWREVTLAHLLANRGGAPADLRADGLWARLWRHRGTPRKARRLLAEGVLARPPVAAPGEKYVYSNAGFSLAGHVLEEALDAPWETLLRRDLFEPLGMESGGFGPPGVGKRPRRQPWGHRVVAGKSVPIEPGPAADNPAAIGPANAVHCTIGDWAKYAALHLRGAAPGKENLLLRRETLRRLHTPPDGADYALGWRVASRKWAGGKVLTHNGSNTMWYAVAWLAPGEGFAVLATCNQGGDAGAKACDEVVAALIQRRSELLPASAAPK